MLIAPKPGPPTDDFEDVAGLVRRDFTKFCRFIYPWYKTAPHLALINSALMQLISYSLSEGKTGFNNLIIDAPPRHGKSVTASQLFPAWFLGLQPDKRVILTSYGASLATKNSREVKKYVSMPKYRRVFNTGLAIDSKAKNRWDIANHSGGLYSVGVGGSVTGHGGDCLTGETMIMTDVGEISISTLTQLYYKPKVLAYDHNTGQLVYKAIVATKVRFSDEIYETYTTNGKSVRSTGNHRFYTVEHGYRSSALLSGEESLITVDRLPSMPGGKGTARENVPAMLLQNQKQESHTNLHAMWGFLRKTGLRIREISTEGDKTELLLKSVFGCRFIVRASNTVLQNLWGAFTRKRPKLLLQTLQGNSKEKEHNPEKGTTHFLPCMWDGIRENLNSAAILLSSLCKRIAFDTYAWYGKFTLSDGPKLREMVHRNAPLYQGERWLEVHLLLDGGGFRDSNYTGETRIKIEFADTSYRRKSDKQQPRQSSNTLQNLPCGTPQISQDTVSVVNHLCETGVKVYDIQVEDCCNFFANGILVHNCIIIDDPLKGRKTAESELQRNNVWEWLISDIFTRREPYSICIVMATRWHQGDPTGRLLLQQHKNWVHISLPAIAEEGDILGRQPGEALWPERYPIDSLLKIKEGMTDYEFSALFQGSPTSKDGGLFKITFFPIIDFEPADIIRKVRFWDLALSGKTSADYTVGLLMGETSTHNYVILDVVRRQLEWDGVPALIKATTIADGETVQVGIEEAFFQSRAVDYLLHDPDLRMYSIRGYRPDTDKFTRALPFAARAGNNQVTVLRRTWTQDYIAEMCAFPMGSRDDQVDATSGAFEMNATYRPSGGIWA